MRKKLIVAILTVLLLSGVVLIPLTHAIEITSPKEQVRTKIEDGFSSYLQEKQIQLRSSKSAEIAFSEFLRENRIYQKYLGEYTNLTSSNINEIMPSGKDITTTKASIQKTVNSTINGKTYQVSISQKTANGQDFIEVILSDTINLEVYIKIDLLTINLLGWQITYGENQYVGAHFFAGDDANKFIEFFDEVIPEVVAINFVFWFIYGMILDAALEAPLIGSLFADFIGDMVEQDILNLQDMVDGAVSETYGLGLCVQNKYIYPLFLSIFTPPDFAIYVKEEPWPEGAWIKAFPTVTPYWLWNPYITGANAYLLSNVIHKLGDEIGYDEWETLELDFPGPENPPSGDSGLLYPEIVCYGEQRSIVNPNVYIDGFDIGTVSSLRITPETHYVGVDRFIPVSGNYGYIFDYIEIEGDTYYQNEVAVELSTNSTITAYYTYGELPGSYVSSIYDYDGPAYDPGNLVGWQSDGQFAQIDGYGPYYYYGWISGAMNAPSIGNIYVYGYGDGPLYVYVSSNCYSWDFVSAPYVAAATPYWIDCGTYLSTFNYILVTAEDPDYFYSIFMDSVYVEPPPYQTLTISSGNGGSTNPSSGQHQYPQGTYATVTAYYDSGYAFDYWLLDGQYYYYQNPISILMDDDHSLQAFFVEDPNTYYYINIHAVDTYFGEGQPLTVNVYVDSQWQGYSYENIRVTEGYHYIEVDGWVDDPVFGWIPFYYWTDDGWNIISYDNPIYINVDTDITLIAWYQAGYYGMAPKGMTPELFMRLRDQGLL